MTFGKVNTYKSFTVLFAGRQRKPSRNLLKVSQIDESYGQTTNTSHITQQTTSSFASQDTVGLDTTYQSHDTVSNQIVDQEIKGDESLPWRRAKPKIRSRSLQPGERNIEDFPWLRQRDRSLPRQEQVLWGHDKVPIKPWIEEVICLKRTELRRKIIERAETEKVFLKASQIERREIIRAQLAEHIDLKSVQKYFERGNFASMAEAQLAMTEEILQEYEEQTNLQQLKHEEDMSILELTKEIDALVKKDLDIPWAQQGQVTTLEKTRRTSRKASRDVKEVHNVQQEELVHKQTMSFIEDTNILKLDKHDQLNVQLIQQQQIGVPWARGMRQQQQQSQQSLSHLNDTSILTVDRNQIDQIQQQEVPVSWRRSRQPEPVNKAQLSHTEDTTILSVKKSMESTQIDQVQLDEKPVAWRRGPRQPQEVAQLSHIEDSTMLDVRQTESEEIQVEEVPVAWRRGGKKPVVVPVQHLEDTAILQVEQSQVDDVQLQDEVAVPWARGQKKPQQAQPLQEVAVPWARGKKQKPQVITQDVLEEPQPQVVEEMAPEPEAEKAPWRRAKKPKPKVIKELSPEIIEPVREPSPELELEQLSQEPDVTEVVTKKIIKKKRPVVKPEMKEPSPEVEVVQDEELPAEHENIEEQEEPETNLPVVTKKTIKKKRPVVKQQSPEVQEPVHELEVNEYEEATMEPQIVEDLSEEPAEVLAVVTKKPIKKKRPIVKQTISEIKQASPEKEFEQMPNEPEEVPEESEEVVEIVTKKSSKIIKKKLPVAKQPSPEVKEHSPDVDVVEIEEQPAETEEVIKEEVTKKTIKKKKPKVKTPSSNANSPDAEEFVDQIPEFETEEQQPTEIEVVDEISEFSVAGEPIKQFILKEVQEIEEVVEKKKIKIRRAKKPEEVAEELIDDEPRDEQIEPTVIPENQETATVEEVKVEKKLLKKKKPKPATKQLVLNDEVEMHEVESIVDESTVEYIADEVTQNSIQLRQAEVKPTVVQTEETVAELETTEEFRKDIDVKMVSNIIKKNKKRLHIDDSQPLPELELITQKRVQQGIDMLAEEELLEDIVKDSIKESLSNTSLPEKLLVKKKSIVVKPPRFLKKLQPAVCQPDQPTVLQCKIDGAPYPEIKWYFNDIELFASEKYVFNVTEKVATLEIVRVTPQDVGVYTCQAKNQAGVATSRSNIVLGKCFYIDPQPQHVLDSLMGFIFNILNLLYKTTCFCSAFVK